MAVEVATENVTPEELKHIILKDLQMPKVFKHKIDSWGEVFTWSPQMLCGILGDEEMEFKLCPRRGTALYKERFSDAQVVYETDCSYVRGTFNNLKEWFEEYCGGKSCSLVPRKKLKLDNPLMEYGSHDYWLYVDYKYMSQLFKDHPRIISSIDWSMFGFEGRDGNQSTMWLGSSEANTPCHYDTYGCNLVAQVWGRKKWILFSPSDSEGLYPTRVPYEESSVFSQVNILSPNPSRHPRFRNVIPYTVVLEPGDVLYVPHQWWHYVESLDPAISINTWIDLPIDNEERVKEALVRTLISLFPDTVLQEGVVNPNEVILPYHDNMDLLAQTLQASAAGDSYPCSGNKTVPISPTILIDTITKPNVIKCIVKELQNACSNITS